MFYRCTSLQSIIIPESVKGIGDNAFYGCTSLQSIIIPESVKKIEDGAFENCSSLEDLSLPNTEINIGDHVFRGCNSSLLSFENDYYSLKNGLFINKIKKSVECVGLPHENEIIPEGVEVISEYAFRAYYLRNSGCSSLKSVTLPDSIKLIGQHAFHDCTSLENINLPESLTAIYDGAFQGCQSLQSVVLSKNLKKLGHAVFSGCKALTEIEIPAGVEEIGDEAFYECEALRKITVHNPNIKFGKKAFHKCTALTEVVLPEGLTWGKVKSKFPDSPWGKTNPDPKKAKKTASKEDLSTKNRQQLEELLANWKRSIKTKDTVKGRKDSIVDIVVEFPNGNEFYDQLTLKNPIDFDAWGGKCQGIADANDGIKTAYFGSGITKVNKFNFPCYGMEGIVFPEGMTDIFCVNPNGGNFVGSFANYTELKKIVVPGNVKNIGFNSFKGCTSLQIVELAEGVESIGVSAFEGCSSLKKIVIPKSVKRISQGAFINCKSLEEIDIPESVDFIGYNALFGCNLGLEYSWENDKISIKNGLVMYKYVSKNSLFIKHGFSEFYCIDKSVNNVEIPDGVREIYEETFKGCKMLENIKIPHTLIRIRKSSFKGCTSLNSIDIPERVSEIEDNAFERCGALKSIVIPESVSKIGKEAFKACKSLTKVVIANPLVEIGENAFKDCKMLQEIERPDTWTDELGVVYSSDHKTLLAGNSELTDYSIKEGTEIINTKAFEKCEKLKRIYFPETIKVLEERAFTRELENVILPASIERLEETTLWCFRGTLKILAVTPPELILEIEEKGMLRISNYKARILVPAESVELYKNASVWWKYQQLIEPITD